ncbi:MAG TPA: acyl-CoA dehydrogenase family protein [Gemmataceae bacterium]|nr:acyl-CoA dehydrogenase family protein [Gemmataceae bacterium]
MALTAQELEKQKQQVEEMLAGPETLGFAKSLFFGHFKGGLLFPYPSLAPEKEQEAAEAVVRVRQFAEQHIDARAIDRNADIPASVIEGLGALGVLGMTAPKEYGGLAFSQQQYCRIMEVIGGHCSSTAVFVNAHHSIGIRALLLFGTKEQQKKWLPDLVRGRKLAAFALTEEQAGSDAANVQTLATPSPDGKSFLLNGAKRYISSGAIAQVLTVMARTPVPGSDETKVTAFLVTPDMPGFQVIEPRMEKLGIRGTATAKLAFHDMRVPAENVLGKIGKGLRIALTVLDFGRTTFGASCTGAAKTCLKLAVQHAKKRVQFRMPLAEFELVKKKIAFMAAHAFAMEATTTQCAAFIDSGSEDYMLETALLKVWSTDHLWSIVNDALQIYGGAGYFTDLPLERMMRDARINMIGEGANDVLRAFIAVVGSKAVGEGFLEVLGAAKAPLRNFGKLVQFGREQLAVRWNTPQVPVQCRNLQVEAQILGRMVQEFGLAVQWVLRHCGKIEVFLTSEYLHERIADAAGDIYAASCTLSRLDSLLQTSNGQQMERHPDVQAGRHFLKIAFRRIRQNLAALTENDDASTTATANAWLQ